MYSIIFIDNIGIISLFLALLILIVFGHYVLSTGLGQNRKLSLKIIRIASTVILYIFYLFAIGVYSEKSEDPHYWNLIGLFVFVLSVAVLRGILDYLVLLNADKKPKATAILNIRDTIWNALVFLGIYTAIVYAQDPYFRWSGYLLAAASIGREVKYRFYDDVFLKMYGVGLSLHNIKAVSGSKMLYSLFNLVLKAYLYITVSYGCIYTLMYFGNYPEKWFAFDLAKSSGSVFMDFIYFSIITLSTVGYGDISPIHLAPKIVSISEILLGYLFIGTLMAMILGRYGSTKMHNK